MNLGVIISIVIAIVIVVFIIVEFNSIKGLQNKVNNQGVE